MKNIVANKGCECNYALCESQRGGNYTKWRWFDLCLYNAIEKLSKMEEGRFNVYSGLNQVKLDAKVVTTGYFVTYVSTSWNPNIAKQFTNNDGMLIKFDKSFKDTIWIYCCDVSWISKFHDECEILFARSIPEMQGFDKFKCKIMDDTDGVQIVSLSLSKATVH